MFKAKEKYKPWESPKLFLNNGEWFEFNSPVFKMDTGRRLLHFSNNKLVGAATIKTIK